MHHLFVINGFAGKTNAFLRVQSALQTLGDEISYTVHSTVAKGEATTFVRAFCSEHANETIRVYACGGDGTAQEVANGIVGLPNASMTIYACGSGNDFVKYYGDKEEFTDIANLVKAEEKPIDLIEVNGERYAINACHFGFDSAVAVAMHKLRHTPVIGGKRAYAAGVAKCLITDMRTTCTVKADGEVLNPNGELLLCTVANGQYVGGSYRCAPHSMNDDGWLEVCLVKPISRLNFLRLMNAYKEGRHLDEPQFQKYIVYRRAKCVEIEAPDESFACSLDGEVIYGRHIRAQVVHHAISFAAPQIKTPAAVVED